MYEKGAHIFYIANIFYYDSNVINIIGSLCNPMFFIVDTEKHSEKHPQTSSHNQRHAWHKKGRFPNELPYPRTRCLPGVLGSMLFAPNCYDLLGL